MFNDQFITSLFDALLNIDSFSSLPPPKNTNIFITFSVVIKTCLPKKNVLQKEKKMYSDLTCQKYHPSLIKLIGSQDCGYKKHKKTHSILKFL